MFYYARHRLVIDSQSASLHPAYTCTQDNSGMTILPIMFITLLPGGRLTCEVGVMGFVEAAHSED